MRRTALTPVFDVKQRRGTIVIGTTPGSPPPVNAPPEACFTFVVDGLTVDFDASCSTDSDGTIITNGYSWDWGDSTTSSNTTVTTSHTYTEPGTYTVTLIVEDDEGAFSDPFSDDVDPEPPPVPAGSVLLTDWRNLSGAPSGWTPTSGTWVYGTDGTRPSAGGVFEHVSGLSTIGAGTLAMATMQFHPTDQGFGLFSMESTAGTNTAFIGVGSNTSEANRDGAGAAASITVPYAGGPTLTVSICRWDDAANTVTVNQYRDDDAPDQAQTTQTHVSIDPAYFRLNLPILVAGRMVIVVFTAAWDGRLTDAECDQLAQAWGVYNV